MNISVDTIGNGFLILLMGYGLFGQHGIAYAAGAVLALNLAGKVIKL